MKKLIIIIGVLLFSNSVYSASALEDEAIENSVHSSSITTSSLTAESNPGCTISLDHKRLIPAPTYDAVFKAVFSQGKFLKPFLNCVYGFNGEFFIDSLDIQQDVVVESPLGKGSVACDIRCSAKLTRESDKKDGPEIIEFIIEMQRMRQDSFVDRTNLEAGAVSSDCFVSSVSDESLRSGGAPQKRSMNSESMIAKKKRPISQDEKFDGCIPKVRHLSILLESQNKKYGPDFHAILTIMRSPFHSADVRQTELKFPAKHPVVATQRQMYTYIQLKEYSKAKLTPVTGSNDDIGLKKTTKLKAWLDLLSIELRKNVEQTIFGKINLYDASDITDPDVSNVIEFLEHIFDSAETKVKIAEQILDEMKREARVKEAERAMKEMEEKAKEEMLAREEAEEKARAEALAREEMEKKARAEALAREEMEKKARAEALAREEMEKKAKEEMLARKEAEDENARLRAELEALRMQLQKK